ncbi:MAG: hypothetical protein KA004_03175 [Verrucomicrobiales bacterium]|nr:hypothetical protein [Verrucomicrobiales bacterium]
MKSILTLIAALAATIGFATAEAANKECPVSGKTTIKATSDYAKKVSFCCEKCKAKFDANPASFADKVAAYKADSGKCLMSGKAADKEQNSEYKVTVGLCCEKCKAKFDANPDKFVGKLKK